MKRGVGGCRYSESACPARHNATSQGFHDADGKALPQVKGRPTVITRCWRFWTAPRSPAAKRWPGCCARATPAPIPPPTTSPCCGWALESLPAAYRPDPDDRWRAHRFWCAAIPPVPPTPSPTPAGRPGWGSPSATPSTPGFATRRKSSTRATAGIRRSNPSGGIRDGAWVAEATDAGRHEPLARRDPADPAQGTPPSRRATTVHRLRRATRHRVHHRHRPPVSSPVNSPAWNCATANTPASRTASARPRPPACATCPVTGPRRTPPGWKSSWPQPIWWPGRN